jgi:hypothetical protein
MVQRRIGRRVAVPNGARRRCCAVAGAHRAEDAAWLGLRRNARSTEATSPGPADSGFGPDAFEVVPDDDAGRERGAVLPREWSVPQPDAATATSARARARARR